MERVNLYSKVENLDKNLRRRRIIRWATNGKGTIYGGIRVNKVKEFEDHYSVDMVLQGCVEDEMGAHNFGYNNISFKKFKKK